MAPTVSTTDKCDLEHDQRAADARLVSVRASAGAAQRGAELHLRTANRGQNSEQDVR